MLWYGFVGAGQGEATVGPTVRQGSPESASVWPLKASPAGGRSSHWEPEVGPRLLTPVHLSCSRRLYDQAAHSGCPESGLAALRHSGDSDPEDMAFRLVLKRVGGWCCGLSYTGGHKLLGEGLSVPDGRAWPVAGASQEPGEGLNED